MYIEYGVVVKIYSIVAMFHINLLCCYLNKELELKILTYYTIFYKIRVKLLIIVEILQYKYNILQYKYNIVYNTLH